MNLVVLTDIYILDQQLIGAVWFLPWQWRVVYSHDGLPDFSATKSTIIFVVFTAQISLVFLWASLGRYFWPSRLLIAIAGGSACVQIMTHIPRDRLHWDEPWLICFCMLLAVTSAGAGGVLRLLGYRFSPADENASPGGIEFRFQIRDLLLATFAIAVLFATGAGGLLQEVFDNFRRALEPRRSTVILYRSMGPAEVGWLVAHASVYAGMLAGAAWSLLASRRLVQSVLLWILLSVSAATLQIGLLRHFQQSSLWHVQGKYPPTPWAAINCYVFYGLFILTFLWLLRTTGYKLLRRSTSLWPIHPSA